MVTDHLLLHERYSLLLLAKIFLIFTMHCLLGLAISLLPRASVHGETRFCPPPGPGPNRDYRDNPAYEISQELDIQWDMDFDDAKIYIQQRDVFNNLPEGMSAKVVCKLKEEVDE